MARLLDEPLTRKQIEIMRDSIDGELNRICVSGDTEEIARMVMFATDNICTLAYSRIKELNELQKLSEELIDVI